MKPINLITNLLRVMVVVQMRAAKKIAVAIADLAPLLINFLILALVLVDALGLIDLGTTGRVGSVFLLLAVSVAISSFHQFTIHARKLRETIEVQRLDDRRRMADFERRFQLLYVLLAEREEATSYELVRRSLSTDSEYAELAWDSGAARIVGRRSILVSVEARPITGLAALERKWADQLLPPRPLDLVLRVETGLPFDFPVIDTLLELIKADAEAIEHRVVHVRLVALSRGSWSLELKLGVFNAMVTLPALAIALDGYMADDAGKSRRAQQGICYMMAERDGIAKVEAEFRCEGKQTPVATAITRQQAVSALEAHPPVDLTKGPDPRHRARSVTTLQTVSFTGSILDADQSLLESRQIAEIPIRFFDWRQPPRTYADGEQYLFEGLLRRDHLDNIVGVFIRGAHRIRLR